MNLKFGFLLITALMAAQTLLSQTASIRGRVIDHRTGEYVSGCYISCLSTPFPHDFRQHWSF